MTVAIVGAWTLFDSSHQTKEIVQKKQSRVPAPYLVGVLVLTSPTLPPHPLLTRVAEEVQLLLTVPVAPQKLPHIGCCSTGAGAWNLVVSRLPPFPAAVAHLFTVHPEPDAGEHPPPEAQPHVGRLSTSEQQGLPHIQLLFWATQADQVPVEPPAVEQGVGPAQPLTDQHHGAPANQECEGGRRRASGGGGGCGGGGYRSWGGND